MSGRISGEVIANGLKLHYWRTGGSRKPAVVFNHGAMDSGKCWTPVVQALEDDFDCIMLDARGHGKSEIGDGDYTSASRAADLKGVLEALELDRPAIGGHSMGADTCIHLAAAHPEAVRAIFLEDPPLAHPVEGVVQAQDPGHQDEMREKFLELIQQLKQMPKDEAAQMAKIINPNFPENEIGPWVESKIELSNDFQSIFFQDNLINPSEAFELITEVTVPSLLIIGEKERMAIVSLDTARKIEAANPNVRIVQLEGASHNIRRDRFEAYISNLKKFLNDVYDRS